MNGKLGIGLVFGGVLALLVAACGGGAATPTPPPIRPSQPTATSAPTASAATATQPPRATATPVPTAVPAPTATPAGPQPKTGGTLNMRWYTEFRRPWDTYHVQSGFAYPMVRATLNNLAQYRQGSFEIAPDLAERWETAADGKGFSFFLRKNVQWSDGKPFTSADVIYNLKRGLSTDFSFNRIRVLSIDTMDAPDSLTVKLSLKEFSNSFFAQMATPFMLMYPAHVPDMEQWQKSQVGTGPFRVASDRANVAYEFTKSPTFYGKDDAGRQLPYLDGLVFHVIVDPALAQSAFLTGRIHCGCLHAEFWVFPNQDKLKREVPGAKFYPHVGNILQLYFNVKRAPFDNLEFRQGFSIGLDKQKIAAASQAGATYWPASALVPPKFGGQWALPPEELYKIPGLNQDHSVDLKIAQEKFAKSGINPKKTKVVVAASNTAQELADLITSSLVSDLGIEATAIIEATAAYSTRQNRGDFQVLILQEAGIIEDPADFYKDFINTGGVRNTGGYSNPRLDALLSGQDKERDPAKRKEMLFELQRLELTEFPKLPLQWELRARVSRPELMNFKTGPLNIGNYDYSDYWLEK